MRKCGRVGVPGCGQEEPAFLYWELMGLLLLFSVDLWPRCSANLWVIYRVIQRSGGGRGPCAKAEGAFTWGASGGAEDKVPPQLPLSVPSLFGWGAWPQVKGNFFFFSIKLQWLNSHTFVSGKNL